MALATAPAPGRAPRKRAGFWTEQAHGRVLLADHLRPLHEECGRRPSCRIEKEEATRSAYLEGAPPTPVAAAAADDRGGTARTGSRRARAARGHGPRFKVDAPEAPSEDVEGFCSSSCSPAAHVGPRC